MPPAAPAIGNEPEGGSRIKALEWKARPEGLRQILIFGSPGTLDTLIGVE